MPGVLQEYYNEFSQGYWADPNPDLCGCRGSGYALSDVDTWHKCHYHCTPTTQHPENDGDYDREKFEAEIAAELIEIFIPPPPDVTTTRPAATKYLSDPAQCLVGVTHTY